MTKYLIGIDCGCTSIKAVIFDQTGNVITTASKSSKGFPRRGPEFEEFDVEDQWNSAASCIKSVIEKAGIDSGDIAGIGITSFGNGCTVLDKDGKAPIPGAFSTDYRADGVVARYKKEGKLARIDEITKGSLYSGQPGPLLRWIKDNEPEAYGKIAYVMLFKDVLAFYLTGVASGDLNLYGGSALLDLETMDYSAELMELYGVPEMLDKMPKLSEDASVAIGYVTAEAAEKTGLPVGAAVSAGMWDIMAAHVGAGALEEGVFTSVAGTWSINETALDHMVVAPGVYNAPYLYKGKYLISANSGASASNYEWFADALGGTARIEAEKRGISRFEALNELIGSVRPGSTPVMYHPFVGQPSVHTRAKANFFNLSTATTYAEIAYALAEGVTFIHKHHYSELMNAGITPKLVRLTGGIARSDEWAQLFADSLNLPVDCVDCDEVGALGVAMSAGIGAGLYRDWDDAIEKCVRLRPRFFPNAENARILQERYEEWELLIRVMTPYWDYKLGQ